MTNEFALQYSSHPNALVYLNWVNKRGGGRVRGSGEGGVEMGRGSDEE